MKRETIETLLKEKLAEGIEAKEIIDAIMAENGKDIEAAKSEKSALEDKLNTATESLKKFEGVNPEELNSKIKELNDALEAKDQEYKEKLADMEFNRVVDEAVSKAGGKNAKAIKALLDIEGLKGSKEQTADIKAALDGLKESDGYLFKSDEPINNPTAPTGGNGNEGIDDLRAAMGLDTE